MTQAEIAVINELKAVEARLGAAIGLLAELVDDDEVRRHWLALARTHLETGFMFAVKVVAGKEA